MKLSDGGQFALYAESVLSEKSYYADYKNGKIDSNQFYDSMTADSDLQSADGFGRYNIRRIALTPPDEKMPAEKFIKYFSDNNIIRERFDLYDGFYEYREFVRSNYDHGKRVTFIYPEDEIMLYAITKMTNPKKAFVAGSYYGYFAIWAMKTIRENNGSIVLSDINPDVCRIARENFDRLGFGGNTEIYGEDSEKLLAERTEPIDMLILDATGRHDDPRPDYRGKRIYGALLNDAKHLLNKGSVIVIHNMEPENPEMKMLVDGLKDINARGTNYDTYNGLGVYIIT